MYDYIRTGFGDEYLCLESANDFPESNEIRNKQFIHEPAIYPAFFVSSERNDFWHKVSKDAFFEYLYNDVETMQDKILELQQFIIDNSIEQITVVESE